MPDQIHPPHRRRPAATLLPSTCRRKAQNERARSPVAGVEFRVQPHIGAANILTPTVAAWNSPTTRKSTLNRSMLQQPARVCRPAGSTRPGPPSASARLAWTERRLPHASELKPAGLARSAPGRYDWASEPRALDDAEFAVKSADWQPGRNCSPSNSPRSLTLRRKDSPCFTAPLSAPAFELGFRGARLVANFASWSRPRIDRRRRRRQRHPDCGRPELPDNSCRNPCGHK